MHFDDTRLFSYTDAQIFDFVTSLPSLPSFSNIIPLSPQYLAKGYRKDELEDVVRCVEFASQLGIHVPPIRRTIRSEDHDDAFYCIMDRIPGETLDTIWPELGWLASLRVAWRLARIVRRLRSVESTCAGSPVTGKCRSYYLDDSFGLPPRANPGQVNAFMNFWANFTSPRQETKKTAAQHSICQNPVFSSAPRFVFTHHDLAPRNIILDREGEQQLWLIDWDLAGFYPRFFEYAGMHNFIPGAGWTKLALWRWKLCAWVASGPYYDRESRWLEIIRSRSTRFRPLGRFNMRAHGYAAVSGRPDNDG